MHMYIKTDNWTQRPRILAVRGAGNTMIISVDEEKLLTKSNTLFMMKHSGN